MCLARGADERLAFVDVDGTIRIPHVNMQGSTIALSQSGNPVLTLPYGPYGESTATVGAGTGAAAYPYRYAGQRLDTFANLYDYKARSYIPGMGRFLQPDPKGTDAGPNLYAYVGDDPVNKADPTGNAPGIGDNSASFGETFEAAAEVVGADIAEGAVAVAGAVGGGIALAFIPTPLGDDTIKARVGPGPFAGQSIPAQPGRPTAAQQQQINQIGQQTGCHTCGTKDPGTKLGNFIGDHPPPTKINPPGGQQQFYPHCQSCSNVQGGRVSQMPRPATPAAPPAPPSPPPPPPKPPEVP